MTKENDEETTRKENSVEEREREGERGRETERI